MNKTWFLVQGDPNLEYGGCHISEESPSIATKFFGDIRFVRVLSYLG